MMNVAFDSLAPRFAEMRAYLDSVRGARRMARPADIDPQAIRALLPFINLIDVVLVNDAVRYRFRLVGTAQSEAALLQYTGRFVDEVVEQGSRPRVLDDLTRVVATCMPYYGRYGMPFPGRGFIDSERVFYPLSEDDRMADCILALHHYPDLDPAALTRDPDWHLSVWEAQRAGR